MNKEKRIELILVISYESEHESAVVVDLHEIAGKLAGAKIADGKGQLVRYRLNGLGPDGFITN